MYLFNKANNNNNINLVKKCNQNKHIKFIIEMKKKEVDFI